MQEILVIFKQQQIPEICRGFKVLILAILLTGGDGVLDVIDALLNHENLANQFRL